MEVSKQIASNIGDSAQVILQRYGNAWQGRRKLPLERDFLLAFWVQGELGGEYHITLSNEPGADVRDGIPNEYDLGFELDIELLRRLDRNEINALTAMRQARGNDPIPLVPRIGSRLTNSPEAGLLFRRLAFHFWTRDRPESILFGEQASRLIHGGNASVLVYDKDFRSAWYQIKPGMHINANPDDQTNEYPQLMIVTRGRFKGRFDGQEKILAEGESVLIPSGMLHEFWAEDDEYGEVIWIAFGEGV